MSLRLDWCDHATAKFACERWHYSGLVPAGKTVKIGVWEDMRFIGAILFSGGPSPNIWKTYKLSPLEGAELSRVALTNHKTPVSRIIAIALRMYRKLCPGTKLVVSYADLKEGHHGGIYQAGNWIYLGPFGPKVERRFKLSGRRIHERNMRQQIIDGKCRRSDFVAVAVPPKHKYVLAFDETLQTQLEKLKKPYPKRAGSKANVAIVHQAIGGGATPTPALQFDSLQSVTEAVNV